MRSFLRCSLILILPALFFACTRKEIEPSGEPGSEISFLGNISLTDEGNAEIADFIWEAEVDRIGIFATSDGTPVLENAYFYARTSSPSSRFLSLNEECTVAWEPGSTYSFHAYYPYRASYVDATEIPAAVAPEQTGIPGQLPDKKNLALHASAEGVSQSMGDAKLVFQSAYAILKFTISTTLTKDFSTLRIETSENDEPLAFAKGTIDITSGRFTAIEGESHSVTYTPETPTSLSSRAQAFYFAVTPGHAGKELRLTADFYGNEAVLSEFTLPDEGLEAGHIYSTEIKGGDAGSSVDLSAYGTANTYIVNKAATLYSFDATVKGNGLGRTYKWTDNGLDKSFSYNESELSIEPADAYLVWYNNPLTSEGVQHSSPVSINSVVYEAGNRRIYFETPENFVEGNALIVAVDAADEVLWSWNIWAVENYSAENSMSYVNGYIFMDRNLGAIRGLEAMNESNDRSAAWAAGNYYQWGRKDPFPAPAELNTKNLDSDMKWGLPTFTPVSRLQQDWSSEWWGSSDIMFGKVLASNVYPIGKHVGAGFSIEDAVAAGVRIPYKWVTSGPNGSTDEDNVYRTDGSYTWMMNASLGSEYVTDWHWLWGGPTISENQKSIHDPCPAGWKVAPPQALNMALSGNRVEKPHGVYYSDYNLYFPYAGQRQSSFGGSQISGLDGTDLFISCSGFTSSDRVHPYRGTKGGITTGNSYAGAGYQVRCVKEEKQAGTSQVRAVIIGDSITEVWEARTDNHNFFKENNYLPKGISGQTSAQIRARFENDVLLNGPLCVAITCGVNDLAGNDNNNVPRTPEEVFANIKAMAETAAEAGIKVVIGATPPTNWIHWVSNPDEWNAKYPGIGKKVIELNNMLRAYAAERGFVIAEYWSALVDENNDLKEEYRFTGWGQNDHVHPNAAAYAIMEPILVKAVNKAINPDEGNSNGNIDDIHKIEW